jgi:hypothetical protein
MTVAALIAAVALPSAVLSATGQHSALQVAYELRGAQRERWHTKLWFSDDVASFAQDFDPKPLKVSEFGFSLRYQRNAHSLFVAGHALTIPTGGAKAWSTDDYACAADHGASSIQISCVSSEAGLTLRSSYSKAKGLEWFDFNCTSYTQEICRYYVVSETGLFAPSALSNLAARL